ncbi:MAG: menaquinone biosynthetic enzyme MqnA/MqnD family protein [Blastocatellia bacterium]
MRIAASTYLNSAPLVYSFSQGSLRHAYEFLGDAAPSRCAAMLADGQCEIALIPVIEYQRIPGLRVIPDVAVASKERVRSVLLAARCSLQEVRNVTLDTSSRTSQTLVKLLFERRYLSRPVFTERTPDFTVGCENMLEGSDAALVIGDPAMRLAAAAPRLGLRIYDLAEEWRLMTGLPFVFAVWAIRADTADEHEAIARDFLAAKREGLTRLDQIAAEYAAELKLPQQDLLSYLQRNVNYDLDAENIAGMQHYFDLAAESGLIPERRPVEFLRRQ